MALLLLLIIRHFVQVIVDPVETGSVRTIHVEPPVANTCVLVEDGAVGAEEAELLPVGQAPVPDLEQISYLLDVEECEGLVGAEPKECQV